MKKGLSFLFTTLCIITFGQQNIDLKNQLQKLIADKNAVVAISIKNLETNDSLEINANELMPMMSVFKFHIGLTAMHLIDQKKLNLNQKYYISKDELLPNTWSPMRDDYPNGNVYLTLDQILRYTVSHSDNNGCDILLKIVGGTDVVQNYITKFVTPFTIEVNEQQMQTWENLTKNTTSALATTQLLEKFYKGKIVSPSSTNYLYQLMVETSRGLTWMKAGLPIGTELAHRTGISDVNDQQIRLAMNDVGIFTLPPKTPIILSIYLKNIKENREATEKLMADITSATYHYYNQN